MESLMSVMRSQINRAICCATNNKVIPGKQNIMFSLSSVHRDTEFGTSGNDQENI